MLRVAAGKRRRVRFVLIDLPYLQQPIRNGSLEAGADVCVKELWDMKSIKIISQPAPSNKAFHKDYILFY